MATIDKAIIIKAPPEKFFDYLTKPSNLLQIWPGLIEIQDEQLLPNGGYKGKWISKMAGMRFKGSGEYAEIVKNQYFVIKAKGAINGTIVCTVRAMGNKTRLTLTIDYSVPVPLLAWLTGAVIVKMNERGAETVLANLRTIMEET
jgi:carbon monoxide dehydrogenase subunit G